MFWCFVIFFLVYLIICWFLEHLSGLRLGVTFELKPSAASLCLYWPLLVGILEGELVELVA